MERIRVGSEDVVVCVTSDQSGGALLALEVAMPPGGGPPFMHRHAAAEVYRVERGELVVYLDGGAGMQRVVASAGTVVPIPGGSAHTVRNESGADALAYVVFAPGAEMERFFRAVGGSGAPTSTAGIEDMAQLAARHGVEITGPIPA